MEAKDFKAITDARQKATFKKYPWNDYGVTAADIEVFKAGQESKNGEIASLIGQVSDLKMLKTQAEITSFKAGMKLVVEWIQTKIIPKDVYPFVDGLILISKEQFQAFLKEHDIESKPSLERLEIQHDMSLTESDRKRMIEEQKP